MPLLTRKPPGTLVAGSDAVAEPEAMPLGAQIDTVQQVLAAYARQPVYKWRCATVTTTATESRATKSTTTT